MRWPHSNFLRPISPIIEALQREAVGPHYEVVLDIETIQAPREEWARLAGKCSACGTEACGGTGGRSVRGREAEAQQRLDEELYAKSAFDGTFSTIVCIGLLEFSDNWIRAARSPGTAE